MPLNRPPHHASMSRRASMGQCLKTLCLATSLFTLVFGVPTAQGSQLETDQPLDMDLKEASLTMVLESMARILGAEAALDPTIDGKVTLKVKSVQWQELTDRICREQRLSCEMIPSEPPVLRARPLDAQPGVHLEAGLVTLIDISLKKADLRQTMESFGVISGRSIDMHPEVSGTVTLNIRHTPWPLAAQLACALNDCVIEWGDTLVVRPLEEGATNPRFRLALAQAERSKALAAATELPSFLPFGPLEVHGTEEVAGRVDIDLDQANAVEILNALCHKPECSWQLIYGVPSLLQLRGPESADDGKMQVHPPKGSDAVHLDVEVESADRSSLLRHRARFTWSSPRVTLQPRPGADGKGTERLILSWVPFSVDEQFVVPILLACDGSQAPRLLATVPLPLEDSWETSEDAFTLRLLPLAAEATQGTSLQGNDTLPCAVESGRLVATRHDATGEVQVHSMAAQAGSYLLLREPGADGLNSALLVLGADPKDGSLSAAHLHLRAGQLRSTPLRLLSEGPSQKIRADYGEDVLVDLTYHRDPTTTPGR